MATSIQLAPEIERRIEALAAQTGRTKTYYLNEMIERGVDEVEDYFLAAEVLERVRSGTENVYSAAEVRRSLDLDD